MLSEGIHANDNHLIYIIISPILVKVDFAIETVSN